MSASSEFDVPPGAQRRYAMPPTQRKLARHALGLPNSSGRSCRNWFVIGECDRDHDAWNALVSRGLARAVRNIEWMGGNDLFRLTPTGALAALEPGETLDPEDSQPIRFVYTNYRGETATREATPIFLRFGASEWHRKPQWLMRAYDHDKQEVREFALSDCGFDTLPDPPEKSK